MGDISNSRETGGEKQVTLNQKQLPAHVHAINLASDPAGHHIHHGDNVFNFYLTGGYGTADLSGVSMGIAFGDDYLNERFRRNTTNASGIHQHIINVTTQISGKGSPHNNMPTYLSVNVWKRIK